MKIFIRLAVLLFLAPAAYSQSESTQFFADYLTSSSKIDGLFTQTGSINVENIGNPYLNKDFVASIIVLNDGSEIKDAPGRFNIFSNRVELKDGDNIIEVTKPLQIEKLVLNDRVFVYSLIITNKKTFNELTAKWFEVLVDGDVQLLGLHNQEVKTDSYASSYMGGGGTKQKFLKESMTLYMKAKNGPAIRFFPTPKNLSNFLDADKNVLVQDFIKSNKLKLSRLDDLIKTMVYANSLY